MPTTSTWCRRCGMAHDGPCPNARSVRRPQKQKGHRFSRPRRVSRQFVSPQWSKVKRDMRKANLCCAYCDSTEGIQIDHIIPVAEGGTDDAWNAQPLCAHCHGIKTQQEINRGIARSKNRR